MNDSTDIDLQEDEQAEEESKASISGRVAALVVLLILLLLACGLLWPVPESERIVDDPEARDRAIGRGGPLELERVEVSIAEGVSVGHKGVAVLVSMDLRSDKTRVFDPGWAKLHIVEKMIPPLSETHEGVSGYSSYPSRLEADKAASISLVYAVPRESKVTTLVVQPGDFSPSEAVTRRLGLPGGP